ncbi:MAG: PTS sugar transporter subunit IIC [Clostridia bacterium]|nr:PTS sugar transporter subunit IIC [Clostridia bacterium]
MQEELDYNQQPNEQQTCTKADESAQTQQTSQTIEHCNNSQPTQECNNQSAPHTRTTLGATVKKLAKRWFIDAFSGMALGLFATLIAGTILEQIGKLIGASTQVGALIILVAKVAKSAMGAGIGAGIAYALKCDKLTIFSCIVAGMVGALSSGWLNNYSIPYTLGSPGNPIGAYVTAIFSAEICKLIQGKTRLDIVLIPLTALAVSSIVAITICPPVSWLISMLSKGIEVATTWSPFLMGIVIAAVMGNILTLPTSSAAIWVAILSQYINENLPIPHSLLIAGGAAVVGCCCHMVGFAVMSFKENRWQGLIAQGLGTSMLQIPNLMRNVRILIPPTIASAILGPVATCVFKLKCGVGAGMGTSGLVGIIDVITSNNDMNIAVLILAIVLLCIALPALLSYVFCMLLRNINWIKPDDLRLDI